MISVEPDIDSISSLKWEELSTTTHSFPKNSDSRSRGRKTRKKWRPIRLSRLPSLRSNARRFDFPVNQHFSTISGYAAGSEESSSSDMSDASPYYGESNSSSDESQENFQIPARTPKRRPSLRRMRSITRMPSMKLRRTLTRKLSGGADSKRKLRKSRSIKLSNSGSSRPFRRYGKLQEDQGSSNSSFSYANSQPHYLKPTSSSDSKNVRIQASPRHTQSSLHKEKRKNLSNPKLNSESTSKTSFGNLTRTASLRPSRTLSKMGSMKSKRSSTKKRSEITKVQDSNILRATCSSALKDSKFLDRARGVNQLENTSAGKLCPYTYCSLHGHRHANVPPLKRFVSMRRRLLKTQKSMKLGNRSSIILKRSFSKKKGIETSCIASDKDTAGHKSGHDNRSTSSVAGEVSDDLEDLKNILASESKFSKELEQTHDGGTPPLMCGESISTCRKVVPVDENLNQEADRKPIWRYNESTGSEFASSKTPVMARKQWAQLSPSKKESRENSDATNKFSQGFPPQRDFEPTSTSESISRIETEKQKTKLWNLIYQHMVNGLNEEAETSEAMNKEENMEDSKPLHRGDGSSSCQEISGAQQVPGVEDKVDGEDRQKIECSSSDAVKLVQHAFDEILSEIPDYSSDGKSMEGDKTPDREDMEDKDNQDWEHNNSTSCKSAMSYAAQSAGGKKKEAGTDMISKEEKLESKLGSKSNQKAPKHWSYLKKVILLKRFIKALENVRNFNPRKPSYLPAEPNQGSEKTHLRHQSIEEKNTEEWMLDYALRQVISALAPSQKRKVALLVQAFETVNQTDNISSPTSSHGARSRARPSCSLFQNDDGSIEETTSGIMRARSTGTCLRENIGEATDLQDVDHPKECDSLSPSIVNTFKEDIQVDEKADEDIDGDKMSSLNLETNNGKSESNAMELEVSAVRKAICQTPSRYSGLTTDESVEAIATGHLTAAAIDELLLESNASREERTENSRADNMSCQGYSPSGDGNVTYRTQSEKKSLIRLRNLIYKHMLTGPNAANESNREVCNEEPVEVTITFHGENNSSNYHGGFGTEQVLGTEEDDYDADSENIKLSRRHAVKLVKQAFEKILSEIPDQSSDDQSSHNSVTSESKLLKNNHDKVSDSTSSSTAIDSKAEYNENLQHEARSIIASKGGISGAEVGSKSNQNMPRNWSNLRKVVLLKKFVKALEKVRNFNPRMQQYLPENSDPDAEKIHLRHQPGKDRKSAEEWMLDYALRQVISTLVPSQRRKVTLLVQAFDTVLDGGQVLTLQDVAANLSSDPADSSSGTPVHTRNDSPIQDEEETGWGNIWTVSIDKTMSSEISLKRTLDKAPESNIAEHPIPAKYSEFQVASSECAGRNFKEVDLPALINDDLKTNPTVIEEQAEVVKPFPQQPGEPKLGEKSSAKCSSASTCKGELTYRTEVEKPKDIKLWSLVYRNIVPALSMESEIPHKEEDVEGNMLLKPAEEVISTKEEHHNTGSQKNETSSNDVVKLVRQALDKMLSEIPDDSSDEQSVDSDITADHDFAENSNANFVEECTSTSSNQPPDEMQHKFRKAITCEQLRNKSNQGSPRGWSNLKKVILLKRFVKALETLTTFSPRKSHHLPQELDSKAEKICLRHQSTEGRKNVEEWMLDYALRQAISTLAPSQKRKVALLAQAFDSVVLKDSGNCSGSYCTASSHMPLQSSPSPPAKRGDETGKENVSQTLLDRKMCSETDKKQSLDWIIQSSSPEEGIPVTHPKLKTATSGYDKQATVVSALQTSHGDLTEEDIPVVPCKRTDSSLVRDCGSQESIPTNGEFTEVMNKEKSSFCLEANGETYINHPENLESRDLIDGIGMRSDKSGTSQEDREEQSKAESGLVKGPLGLDESEHTHTANVACDTNVENQKYMSLWRSLCRHMVLGTPTEDGSQPLLQRTSKQGQNNADELLGKSISNSFSVDDGLSTESHDSDKETTNFYQIEAIKLLEEAIDEISLPESQDDTRDDQSTSRDIVPEKELPVENHGEEETEFGSPSGDSSNDGFKAYSSAQKQNTIQDLNQGLLRSNDIKNHENPETTQKGEIESGPQTRKSWSKLKRVILLKRFVKAMEKVRKLNPREPRYLPLNPDPEAEKVNLRHQDAQDRRHGDEWMLDYALQEVVAKLTPARKRKVALLVEAFEKVTPATGN